MSEFIFLVVRIISTRKKASIIEKSPNKNIQFDQEKSRRKNEEI